MARNPYAGVGGGSDPYTNGNGYRASPAPSGSGTDDYDPYGERYNTPPAASDTSRERRAARAGGYGGFYDHNNNPGSSAGGRPPDIPPSRSADSYSSRATEERLPIRSPRRPSASGQSGSYHLNPVARDPSQGSRGSDTSRSRERDHPNGLRSNNDTTSRSRSRGGGGDGTRQIEEVLAHIKTEWKFMADDSCIPVQVALQLMDTSSLGRAHQYGQFQDTHKQLRRALKAIVNEHHQGFNSSIGTFHTIQTSIQTSQTRLRNLKDSLAQSRVNLSSTKPELKVLASASQGYDEMLQVLSTIEKLRSVMEKLEARISEKRFLSAVEVLQDALKLLRRPDMDNIGALSDLRVYLANQESSLTDILIEELHSHLYLRSPYCQDRWKAHAREQSSGASVDAKDGNVPAVQPLWQYLESDLISAPTTEDPAKNPESNSFYYIQLLLESLHKMDRLAIAVNAIEQRMPLELFKVVDKTNNEVDQRHPTSMRSKRGTSTGKADLSISDGDARALVIYDLLWTLYAKFEAIAEGHRVLHDVVSCIAKRDNLRNHDVLTGSFKELWMLYQNEIRSLLHDYLATDSNMYRMSVSMDEDSTVFRRGTRRKDKKLFHLSDTDPKSVEMKTEFEDLESILKASVPGLVSGATQSTGVAADEKHQQTDGAATGHKLLIEPSVFNMALLLPPSLAFLQRLKDIVPPGPDIKTSLLTSFLDDFLVNVFLPQLDETLMKMSSQVFNDANAFQEEAQWAQVAKRPIFHGASAFLDLVTAFCKMLATIPHDQAFSQLIITQMAAYYEKCNDWYKSVVARSADSTTNTNALKTSAMLAIGPGEIHDLLHKASLDDSSDQKPRHRKEVGLLLASTKDSSLELQDVIMDRKSISSLCLLYTSMKWLSVQVSKLRRITTNDIDSSRRTQSMRPTHNRRWTLINAALRAGEEKSEVYLPMTQETVSSFDAVLASYQSLAETVLLNLHLQIRCSIIHSLSLALSPDAAPYLLEQVVNDPDPRILALNADLVSYDEIFVRLLRDTEVDFVRMGLGELVNALLISRAPSLGPMNANGCGRMQLNILVLQQNLKNIENDVSLQRAAQYYDLFTAGPEAILAKAKEGKEPKDGKDGKDGEERFEFEELKALVELCFSEQLANPERGVSTVARRTMGECVLQLSEQMWQS